MANKDILLNDLRTSIDHLDHSFLYLLSERMRMVERILDVKRIHSIDYAKSEIRMHDINQLTQYAVEHGMDEDFLDYFFTNLFQSAIEKYQDKGHTVIDIKEYGQKLNELRKSLFNLEKAILTVLLERFKVVRHIGHVKQLNKIPALDEGRWSHLLNEKLAIAVELGIATELVEGVYTAIHDAALKIENKLLNT